MKRRKPKRRGPNLGWAVAWLVTLVVLAVVALETRPAWLQHAQIGQRGVLAWLEDGRDALLRWVAPYVRPGGSSAKTEGPATTSNNAPTNNTPLRLYFLDVGQGDAVLVVTPENKTMLYDAGRKEGNALGQLQSLGVQHLDIMVSSHGDADHIAAQEDIARAYPPKFYMDNGLNVGTLTQRRVLAAIKNAGATLLKATDRRIVLGSATLQIFAPPLVDTTRSNPNSIGVLLRYGNFKAWFSGDSEQNETQHWLSRHWANPDFAKIDVYKSIHHGAKNGDSSAWLRVLRPKLAVIQVGKDNLYGHPAPSVLALYRNLNIPVLRTDQDGTIAVRVQSDGRYSIKTNIFGATQRELEAKVGVGLLR